MCVDLNGLVYIYDYYEIQILDARKNYAEVQKFGNKRPSFFTDCVSTIK